MFPKYNSAFQFSEHVSMFQTSSSAIISLHVRAVKLVILVKPIGILTHVLMSISFGTKIPTFLNISMLQKVVEISVIFLVLRFLIYSANTYSQLKIKESYHIEQLKPELNKQVEHVSLSLHF